MTFGEYFKQKRIESRQTLREFCRKHKLDPGNTSKLERGRVSAPRSEERILQYADYLKIPVSERQAFKDLAAISAGRIPKDLTDEELAKKLPVLFRVARGKKLDPEKLRELVELIRKT